MINQNLVEIITANLVNIEQMPMYFKIYNKRQDLWIFVSNTNDEVKVSTRVDKANDYVEYYGFYKFVVIFFYDASPDTMKYEIIARIGENRWTQLTIEDRSLDDLFNIYDIDEFGELLHDNDRESTKVNIKIFENIFSLKKAVNSFYIMEEDFRDERNAHVSINIIPPYHEEA